jgi:hypothetical protein
MFHFRDPKVVSLLRDKRAADTNYRKLQNALLEFSSNASEGKQNEEKAKKSNSKKVGHTKNNETITANEKKQKILAAKKELVRKYSFLKWNFILCISNNIV